MRTAKDAATLPLGRAAPFASDSLKTKIVTAVSATPIARSSMKISRQPAASAMRAPIMGAVTGAIP